MLAVEPIARLAPELPRLVRVPASAHLLIQGEDLSFPVQEVERVADAEGHPIDGWERCALDDEVDERFEGVEADDVRGVGDEVRQGVEVVEVGLAIAGIDEVLDATDVHARRRDDASCVLDHLARRLENLDRQAAAGDPIGMPGSSQ